MDDNERKPPEIAARQKGPGPGSYALPSTIGAINHDITKQVDPAFSFGLQLPNSIFRKTIGMGPCYQLEKNFTRFGKDGTPSYSIIGRPTDLKPFNTPSPYAYSPEKCHPQREKHAPRYSMGARRRLRKLDQTPAANSYNLPPTIGSKIVSKKSVPSFSMTGRPKVGSYLDDLAKTPGPGSHSVVHPDTYKHREPSYSLLARNVLPGDNTRKPGPGAHSPEKVVLNRNAAPKYSMGTKHSDYICVLIPEVSD